jgi:hypothetical protein
MTASPQPTAYGRIFPPRADWLARAPVEPIIEPELPIVDTHHHVWRNRGGWNDLGAHRVRRTGSSCLVEQRLRLDEIRGTETFGESGIYGRDQIVHFPAPALSDPQPAKADGRPQLPQGRVLLLR